MAPWQQPLFFQQTAGLRELDLPAAAERDLPFAMIARAGEPS
jgi:hypothetical protein